MEKVWNKFHWLYWKDAIVKNIFLHRYSENVSEQFFKQQKLIYSGYIRF